MKPASLAVLLAVIVSSAGCTHWCRRTPPVAAVQACVPVCPPACPQVCPPGTVPLGEQAVTYGMPTVYEQ